MKAILLLLFFFPSAVIGPVMCGTGTASGTGTAWTNAANITADDNSDASFTGTHSNNLIASNFDFSSLPQGATITQVSIDFEATGTVSSGHISPAYKYPDGSIVDAGGVQLNFGTTRHVYNRTLDKSIDPNVPTVTANQLRDPSFGIALSYFEITSATVTIDYVTVTVTYSVGGGFFQLMSKSQ
jgi:hypothetical protein